MYKVIQVAWREFVVTVMSKAFLIGLLLLPLIGIVTAWAMPRLFADGGFEASGTLALVDPDGRVVEALRPKLAPETIRARREAETARALEQMPSNARALVGPETIRRIAPRIDLALVERPRDADLDAEKARLYSGPQEERPLALVVVHEDAVEPADGTLEFGSYDLFVRPRLDNRIENEIRRVMREAIIDARLSAHGYEPATLQALFNVPRIDAVAVRPGEESGGTGVLTMLLPMAFGALLFIGVMTGGQALLTSTVEEKSSRVIEVLLSAVSPMQLMAGKLLGQMAVSLVGLGLYIAMGLVFLAGAALLGLLDLSLIFYLAIFFVITYLVLGSLMMAIGSAVNEMREAQTMMTPIVLLLVMPWMLWMPISRAPDSTFSVVLSFVPPINSFAMLFRMASTSPPPAWQVWLTIAIGFASALGALWFTAKVFRIGLLMHGKPPTFMTLVRWARQA
ncbi:MAG TPA: ABC transporter permease [Gammaproteobacteria bacterium]